MIVDSGFNHQSPPRPTGPPGPISTNETPAAPDNEFSRFEFVRDQWGAILQFCDEDSTRYWLEKEGQ